MARGGEYDLLASYIKRIRNWEIIIKELEVKKNLPKEELIIGEGKMIISALPKNSFNILLDSTGKMLSSVEFANQISLWQNSGKSAISFIIGGAEGHGEEIRKKSDFILSLGKMTWPHMLARVMLVEQLYRSYSILNSHPYHK